MSLLKKIQTAPQEKKIKIVWFIIGLTAAILIVAWIFIGNYKIVSKTESASNYIQSLIQTFKTAKEQKIK